jgi:hypothetical protein
VYRSGIRVVLDRSSLYSLMPGVAFGVFRRLEHRLQPWMKAWAMFTTTTLVMKESYVTLARILNRGPVRANTPSMEHSE